MFTKGTARRHQEPFLFPFTVDPLQTSMAGPTGSWELWLQILTKDPMIQSAFHLVGFSSTLYHFVHLLEP